VKSSGRGVAISAVTWKEHHINASKRSKRGSEHTVARGAGKVAAIPLDTPGQWKRERHRLHVEEVL
jgi:hypothetical protein